MSDMCKNIKETKKANDKKGKEVQQYDKKLSHTQEVQRSSEGNKVRR